MRPISARRPSSAGVGRVAAGGRPRGVHRDRRPIAKPAASRGNGRARQAVKPRAQRSWIRSNRRRCATSCWPSSPSMNSADRAATWARAALPAKNSLTASDAKLVEDAFEQRLSQLPSEHRRSQCAQRTMMLCGCTRRLCSVAAPDASDPVAPSVPGQADDRHRQERAGDSRPPPLSQPRPSCGSWRSSPASSAAASRRTRIICATCSRRRSAARPATSSRSRSAAPITAQRIAPATSGRGGRPPASIRSRPPASSGRRRA